MTIRPKNVQELRETLRKNLQVKTPISSVDLSALHRLVEHCPEDMTATVEAGMIFRDLQEELKTKGQWLPLDPPSPAALTVGAVLSENRSGPRRWGHGTVRDYLLGMKLVLASGELIQCGGKVVKNVAGYDLAKLFIGARDSLGIIVEATFKLKPLPETQRFVEFNAASLAEVDALLHRISESDLVLDVLDAHNLAGFEAGSRHPYRIVLGMAGSREDVDYQWRKAGELGSNRASSLAYQEQFISMGGPAPVRTWPILPSRLVESLRGLESVPWVARAGNGVIYYRGGPELPASPVPQAWMRRLKAAYDPHHLLPILDF